MKKLYCGLICIMLFVITGCKNNLKGSNSIAEVVGYVSSLKSYELKGDMIIHRESKDVNVNVNVCYLEPSYYKVSFNNPTGNEQLIVKNDDGVFVLTPALNKEFKFDSEWPLNSSNAYLLSGIINDIKTDNTAAFEINGDLITISAKLANKNNTVATLKFVYNLKSNTPQRVALLDENNNEKIIMEIKEFNPNKQIDKSVFNHKLIMNEKSNVNETTENKEEKPTVAITAGYVCDGSTLDSTVVMQDITVLCYKGQTNYTIIVNKADDYLAGLIQEEYNSVEFLDAGLLMIGQNSSKFYIEDIEVSIYTQNMTTEELLAIAADITLI